METKTIQLTSGRGPRECEWVVANTLAFLLKKAEDNGLSANIISKQEGKTRNELLSVTVKLKGKKVSDFVHTWIGTIQWIGESPFRKNHRRKNWFIGIFEINEEAKIQIDEKDVIYQTMRSSGSGGQHVNKVSSAVRVIHEPTGLIAMSSDNRSQLQNKKLALSRLKEKILAVSEEQVNNAMIDKWMNHLELQRGNPIKIFHGSKFNLKK